MAWSLKEEIDLNPLKLHCSIQKQSVFTLLHADCNGNTISRGGMEVLEDNGQASWSVVDDDDHNLEKVETENKITTIYPCLVPNRILICKIVKKDTTTVGWTHPYSNRLLSRRGTCSFYYEFAANGSASLIGSRGQKTRKNFNIFLDSIVENSVINFYFDDCWDVVKNYEMVKFFSHHRKNVKYLTLELTDWILNWACDKCVSVPNILRIFSPNLKALTIRKFPYYWEDEHTVLLFSDNLKIKKENKSTPELLPPAARLEKLKIFQFPLKFLKNCTYILKGIVKMGVKLKDLNIVYGEKEKQKYLETLKQPLFQPGQVDKTMIASVTQAREMKHLKFDPQVDALTLSFIASCEPPLELIQVKVSSDVRAFSTVQTILPSILESSSESLKKVIFSIAHLQFPYLLKSLPNFPQLKEMELDFRGPFPNKAVSATESKRTFIKFSDTRFPSLHHLTLSNCPPPQVVGSIPMASCLPNFAGQCPRVKFLTLKSTWLVHKEWLAKLSTILPQVEDLWINDSNAHEDFSDLQDILNSFTKLQRLQLKLTIGPSVSPYAALKAATLIGGISHPKSKPGLDLYSNGSQKAQEFRAEFYPMEGLDRENVSEVEMEKKLSDWLYSPSSLPTSFLLKPDLPFKIPVTIYANGFGAIKQVVGLLERSCMWKKQPSDVRRRPQISDAKLVNKSEPRKEPSTSSPSSSKVKSKINCPDPPSVTSKTTNNIHEIRNSNIRVVEKMAYCCYFLP